jgi:NAD-dependent DNA ligase
LKFFNLITPEQLLKIKAKCTAQQFIEKIKANHNINEIILEFQKKMVTRFDNNSVIIFQLGRAIGNKVLANKLILEYGQTLLDMDQKDLCKIDRIGKVIAQKIEMFGKQYESKKKNKVLSAYKKKYREYEI